MKQGCFAKIWQLPDDLAQIVAAYHAGEVFAYPTEAVFGLGGNPTCAGVAKEIIRLKQGRELGKGFVLVAGNWQQCEGFVDKIADKDKQEMLALGKTRATTFILPRGEKVDSAFCDAQTGRVAIRIAHHPVIQALCAAFAAPLVSSSANLTGQPPLREMSALCEVFAEIAVVSGNLGIEQLPSRIIDWQSKTILRA